MGNQPVSFDAPLKQATTVPAPSGVSFDAPLTSDTSVSLDGSNQGSNSGASKPSSFIHVNPNDSTATKIGKYAAAPFEGIGAVGEGVGEGLYSTLAGGADIVNRVTGQKPGAITNELHKLAGTNDTNSDPSQMVGKGSESLAEFLLGDEALKALPLSARLAKAGKMAKIIEESPMLNRVVQAGIRAVRGGTVGAAQGALKSGGDTTATVGGGAAGAAVGLLPDVADATKAGVAAMKKPFSLKAVQEALAGSKEEVQQALQSELQNVQNEWHGNVRDLFDSVAKDAEVTPKPAESLHDVAANLADAVKQKASGLYKQLDAAVGGTRFQTFDEQLNNVKRALRNSAGIDPDADGRLIERINTLEDAKANALKQAKQKGVDPGLISKANKAWQQSAALSDLSKHIQAATSGLRADLANGVNAAREELSPTKLASRANRMFNSGRLQQAIPEHADDLLQAIESTKQRLQDAATNAAKQTEAAIANSAQKEAAVKLRRTVAGAATGATLGGVPAVALLKHLLGD